MILWRPVLLQNVTITAFQVPMLFRPLLNNDRYGGMIHSLHIRSPKPLNEREAAFVMADFFSFGSDVNPRENQDVHLQIQIAHVRQLLLEKLVNLKEFIIEDPFMLFQFTQKVNERLVPLSFLSRSLKKLYVGIWHQHNSLKGFSARNVVWILCFIPSLRQATIGFFMNHQDALFLSDHVEAFNAVSNVRELALRVLFILEQRKKKPWWGTEGQAKGKGGNKETLAVGNLLKVSNSKEVKGKLHRTATM